jgi:hypothetical protein
MSCDAHPTAVHAWARFVASPLSKPLVFIVFALLCFGMGMLFGMGGSGGHACPMQCCILLCCQNCGGCMGMCRTLPAT